MAISLLRRRTGLCLAMAAWTVMAACSTSAPIPSPSQAERSLSSEVATSEPASSVVVSPDASQSEPSPAPAVSSATVASGDQALVGDLQAAGSTLVLVGGIDGDPAVWTSDAGTTWRRESVAGLSRGGHLADAISYRDGVVAVGWASQQVGGSVVDRPIVVARTGDIWRVVGSLPLPDGLGGLLTGVAASDTHVVVAGALSDGSPATWITADEGASWAGPSLLPGEPGSSVSAVTFVDREFIAVGEVVGAPSAPAVWRSPDGQTWELESPESGGAMADVAAPPLVRSESAMTAMVELRSGPSTGVRPNRAKHPRSETSPP